MKTTLGIVLGVLFAFSLAGCDDGGGTGGGGGGDGGSGGTAGSGGGTAGSGGGTAGSGGGTGGSGGGAAAGCDAYCADVTKNCTGANAQYGDEATCMTVCANYAAGMVGAMDGDSLACRTYHGGAPAAGMPGTHCPHAGPLGGGVCGASDCDNFCELVDAVCAGQATKPYEDKEKCMGACMLFPDIATVPYNPEAVAGDSLACRTYHLTVASTSAANAMTHCPHTAADSATCK